MATTNNPQSPTDFIDIRIKEVTDKAVALCDGNRQVAAGLLLGCLANLIGSVEGSVPRANAYRVFARSFQSSANELDPPVKK